MFSFWMVSCVGSLSVTLLGTGMSSVYKEKGVSWFLLSLIFLIPLQNIYLGKIPSLGAGINILNVLMLLSFFSVFSIKETIFKTDLNKPIFIFLLTYFISWINSNLYMGWYDPESIFHLKDFLFSYLFFFVVYKACSSVKHLRLVFYATILPLPYMFKVYYTNLSWMGFSHYSDKLRFNGGTFMSLGSNEINAFYVTYTFVILSVASCTKNRWGKCFLYLVALLNIYCIVYGFSRGAYLSLIVGLIIWAFVSSKVKYLVSVLVLFLLLVTIGVSVLPKATVERFDMTFTDEEDRDESAESRIKFWELAFDYYLQNPIVGIGYRNFPKVNPAGLDTHNYYVKVMVENGTIGLIALFVLLRSFWKKIRELQRKAHDPFLEKFAIGMIPCMVALLIGNLFGDRFTYYPLISYFFVYMAIVCRGIEITDRATLNES